MDILSLVLGIISMICCAIPVYGNVAAVLISIPGVVFGAIARRRAYKRGVATAGMILSIVACVISVIVIIVLIGLGVFVSEMG